MRRRRYLPGARGASSAKCSVPLPLTFGRAREPGAVSEQKTPCGRGSVAIRRSRTGKEPLTKLNAPASFRSQCLNSALCFLLVGLLCQIPFSSKRGQDFVIQRLPSTESAWRTVGTQ